MLLYLECYPPCEVSEEDYDYLNGFSFTLNGKYLKCNTRGSENRDKYLHVIVAELMGLDTSNEIDHDDRNTLNNQRYNLRPATKSQNLANSSLRKDNKTGFKGVTFNKIHQKYRARIRINTIEKHLGWFDDPEKAAKVYDEAAKKYFGEFANING